MKKFFILKVNNSKNEEECFEFDLDSKDYLSLLQKIELDQKEKNSTNLADFLTNELNNKVDCNSKNNFNSRPLRLKLININTHSFNIDFYNIDIPSFEYISEKIQNTKKGDFCSASDINFESLLSFLIAIISFFIQFDEPLMAPARPIEGVLEDIRKMDEAAKSKASVGASLKL